MSYDAYLAGLGRDELIAIIQMFKKNYEGPFGRLMQRMNASRAKYPDGCTVLSLIDECGEVMHAINKYEDLETVCNEILDTAAVAMRLYLGEVDKTRVIDGLCQYQYPANE